MANQLKKAGIYITSFLGAVGTGLQNYMAAASLVKDLMDVSFAASKAGLGIIHGVAATLGGLCSGLVNLCINVELIESFLERITKKKRPHLEGWQKFRYWFGSGVFIVTGLMFGLTAFAFGPVGALAALGIASGIFVSAIMIVQELETWLESFDNPENKQKKTIKEIFIEWKASLTKGKILGVAIAVGNVVALSLLFTLGLATFLTGVGVPALPALIAAAVVAFTGGAFTEFYFYNRFLSGFCGKLKENWEKFKSSALPVLGFITAGLNGIVNGVLCYVGIMMITSLLTAASIAVPPLGVLIAVAATAAVFAAAASFILGLDFWQRNSGKWVAFFKKQPNEMTDVAPVADTKSIFCRLKDAVVLKAVALKTWIADESVNKTDSSSVKLPIKRVTRDGSVSKSTSALFSSSDVKVAKGHVSASVPIYARP